MGQSILNIFWNPAERRLRALWRVLITDFLWLSLQIAIGAIAGFLILIGLALSGRLHLTELMSSQEDLMALLNSPVAFLVMQFSVLLATLAVVWPAGRFLDRRRFIGFGFHFSKRWWADFAFGLGLGGFLMGMVFLAELAAGWIRVEGFLMTADGEGFFPLEILPPLAVFVCVGISEELYHRGYRMKNFSEGLKGFWLGATGAIASAVILTSVFFGLMHSANPNVTVISVANLMAAGVFLALGYVFTGELALPIGLHITWNFFQGNVFGFPVSGLEPIGASFLAIRQGGPDAVTGGAFGPEGGWIGVGAMLIGSLLILLWVRATRGRLSPARELTESPARGEPSAAEHAG
ncbi:MAG: CPBP family intramembrane metalloprotease [Anaerolineales bacterium]|nr:CPBP family intramembrane metalloprotease [Anaerolineales bacterium]